MITRNTTVETYKDVEIFECRDERYGTEGLGIYSPNGAFEGPFVSLEWAREKIDGYAPKPAPRKRQTFAPTSTQRCRRCGQSEFSGAMFTTDPSSGFCDDCYG